MATVWPGTFTATKKPSSQREPFDPLINSTISKTVLGEWYQPLAQCVGGVLDRYGGDHDRLAVLYHRGMELELRFFDPADRRREP